MTSIKDNLKVKIVGTHLKKPVILVSDGNNR